ncbi:MFS transporter [Streptomyces sp. b94]|uniref:MFS transporter n=1 Tax=Streptomyces sp. b94 TaxID=1827634 RepID=UPI001B398CE1|nr:MFS transporter [Streptomyces sp. b94]MBQ1098244.1 MFS transporter [Streptomyces sp. b94]
MNEPSAPASPVRVSRKVHRDLRILWWTNAVDGLGTQAAGIVLPLLILDLGHSAATAGAFASAVAVVGVVSGPIVARPADHGHRRVLLIGSATLAAAAMAALTVALLWWRPPLWTVLGLAFAERLCAFTHEAAARGALAHVARPAEVTRGAAGLQAGDQAALVVGPGLGGALFEAARPLPFLADALSYAATALGIRALRAPLDPPVPERRKATAGTGFRTVARSALLRMVLVWASAASVIVTLLSYTAVFVLDGDGGTTIGLVLSASGAAGLVGALLAPGLVARLGARGAVVLATWLLLVPAGVLVAAGGAWSYAAGFALLALLLPTVTVVLSGAMVRTVPRNVQSQAGAAVGATAALAAAGCPALAAGLLAWKGPHAPAVLCLALLAPLAVYTHGAAGRLLTGEPAPAGLPPTDEESAHE